ncbi:AAA family ATPase [Listeria ilorinensis]|uniref:AAA family ATPase n=1 Tax=Listeria ilorinensis TaxID=2867439 RepID=UPI001EF6345D|nr:MoxR family ATPase [Listeria ilorinensis]
MTNQPFLHIEKILNEIEKVIVGKRNVAKLSLTALLAGGHVLIEDVPGVGKTMLVRALAKSIGTNFKRIQFTPDLLPADVTGVSVFNPETREFEFRPGPIMGNIVLADEINRTAPRTQAALLEGMAEKHVTVDGITRSLNDPFFVMATQNPIEYEGTYPLPEAQLDRFMLKINMGYPTREEELALLSAKQNGESIEAVETVVTEADLLHLKEAVKAVFVSEEIKRYIVSLTEATRQHQSVALGVSPRGTVALMQAAQSFALIEKREFVLPDDIQYLLPFAYSHRLLLKPEALYNEETNAKILTDILAQIPVPVEKG